MVANETANNSARTLTVRVLQIDFINAPYA
jgi:hypothetical protein